MLDVASPPARRTKPATYADPRLLAGVLLILISLVVGARVVAGADKTVPVLAAARDLPVGHVLFAGDLKPVQVRLSTTGAVYAAGGTTFIGKVVTRDVRAGELVALSALVDESPAPYRVVVLAVKSERVADSIVANTVVDVIATSTSAGGGKRTWTVAKGLQVLSRSKGAGGGFAAADPRVVVRVPTHLVLPLTAAMRSAEIDVVRVPTGGVAGDIGDLYAPSVAPSAGPPGGDAASASARPSPPAQ